LSSKYEFLEKAPIVKRLLGILSPDTSFEDYKGAIEGKYSSDALLLE